MTHHSESEGNMKKVQTTLALLLSTGLLCACSTPASQPTGSGAAIQGDPIKIAVVAPFTGDGAVYGEYTKQGAAMALDEINASGGVLGRPLEIVYEDDKASSTDAASVAQKIASDDSITGVVGHFYSSCTLAAAPIYQNAGVPDIAVASTNPQVAEVGDYVFRINVGDNYQGGALADLLSKQDIDHVAVLYDNSDYGKGVSTAFSTQWGSLGKTVTLNEGYMSGSDDFSLLLTQVKNSPAQVMVLCGYDTDAAKIMMQSKTLGVDLPVYCTDGIYNENFIKIGKEATENAYIVCYFHPDDPSESVQNFIGKFKDKYDGKTNSWSPFTYDAVMLMADAINRAGSSDRAAVRDAIAATKDFSGATGKISFEGAREPVAKELVLLQVRGGEYVVVENAGLKA